MWLSDQYFLVTPEPWPEVLRYRFRSAISTPELQPARHRADFCARSGRKLVATASSGLSPLAAQKRLRRRWLLGPTVVPTKEPLLNLDRDSMQPLLGLVCSLLVVPDVGL